MKSKQQIINDYLLNLGFVPNVKGYTYLREALSIVLDKHYLCNLKIEVYPLIATKYNTSSENIEKNISNAIDRTWLRSNIDVLTSEFGYAVNEHKGKPTVKEFLSQSRIKLLQDYPTL